MLKSLSIPLNRVALNRVNWKFAVALVLLGVLVGCTPLPGESWANFTVDGQYVYVAFQEYLFRVDTAATATPNTRPIDWVAKAPNNATMYTAPALTSQGVLFVGTYGRDIHAFSPLAAPRNMAISTWDSPTSTDKYIGSGTVNEPGKLLYMGNADKGIRAYDLASGKMVNEFNDMTFGVWSTPILDAKRDLLYVASLDHTLYALEADTLAKVWEANTGGALYGTPLFDGDYLYMGNFASEFLKINAADGVIEKRLTTDGGVWATPVLEDGVLYFGDLRGTFYAVDAQTFEVRYRVTDTDGRFGPIRGRAVLATDQTGARIVLVGSENKFIRALTTDLIEKWKNTADDRIMSDLAVIGDEVIFSTLSANQVLTGYNINNGQRMWDVRKPTDDDMNRTASGPAPAMPSPQPTAEATPAR